MAKLAVLISGLLLNAESQASGVSEADHSTAQGFLSKYVTASTQLAATSNVKHGNGPDALSRHNDHAEHGPAAYEGTSPFMIIDDKPILHPVPQMQDSFAFTSASGRPALTTKGEENAAQKMFANGNSTPITLSAIGVGLLVLVTMLGVRMQRGLRPATVLAGRGAFGSDMSNIKAPGLNNNTVEMKSSDSSINSVAFGEDIFELKHGRVAMLTASCLPVKFHPFRSGASWMFEADRFLGEWDPLNFLPSDPTSGWQPTASFFGVGAAPAAPQPAVFFVAASSSTRLRTASTTAALFIHPGAGQTTTLKPPEQIDPFNPFGASEDPMHGHEEAADHLTTDHLDVLARLASKLKHMRLEDIEQVFVIGLSDRDLELQVMTCEDEECVSVLVPVEFIVPCSMGDEEDFEECVLDNLLKLDENLEPDPEEEGARPSARYVRNDLQRAEVL